MRSCHPGGERVTAVGAGSVVVTSKEDGQSPTVDGVCNAVEGDQTSMEDGLTHASSSVVEGGQTSVEDGRASASKFFEKEGSTEIFLERSMVKSIKMSDAVTSSFTCDYPDVVLGSQGLGEIPAKYAPFVSQGSISLLHDPTTVRSVNILRDTGSTQTLLLSGILPLDERSSTGESVHLYGISVPLVNKSCTVYIFGNICNLSELYQKAIDNTQTIVNNNQSEVSTKSVDTNLNKHNLHLLHGCQKEPAKCEPNWNLHVEVNVSLVSQWFHGPGSHLCIVVAVVHFK